MANDDQRRKNFWDEEEDDDRSDLRDSSGISSGSSNTSEEIDRKIHETRVLLEQTHQLYQHYFNQIENRTPVEKLKLLETKINELQRIGTNLTTSRFKLRQFILQYQSFKELWERKLRDLERK